MRIEVQGTPINGQNTISIQKRNQCKNHMEQLERKGPFIFFFENLPVSL